VPSCDKVVEAFVGSKKPAAKVNVGAGSAGHWWATEDKIDGIAAEEADKKHVNVVTLVWGEDKVSRLHGKEI